MHGLNGVVSEANESTDLESFKLLRISLSHFSGRRRPESVEWETLTKRNFSSQIRANPHLLLVITVPWSGESRSLMKEVALLVAGKGDKLGYLKLMVVYRNSDKFLADALGASEGITLFYYHHSTPYKYQGRLRAQNILSSVYHFMLLQTEEVPLKPIHTQQDLETFSQSTDKAVFLLDFCGWSAKLLHRRDHGDTQATQAEQKNSGTVEILEQDFSAEAGGEMSFEKMTNQKMEGLESESLTYRVKSGPADSSLLGRWTNKTDSQGTTYGGDDTDMPCTEENFHKFNSFFWDFMKISRDYFLPPERHRFGLISEKSLLPFLDIGNPDTWLVVVKFSGCSNCSMILHEGDDLRNILQMHHALVKELDADGSLESVFPAKRPSVILFIDRSSGSSKLRGESNSALQILRKFVKDNHLFGQIVWGQDTSSSESAGQVFPNTWSQIITGHSFQHSIKDSVTPKLVKFQDNMAIMITNEGKSVALDATADPHGNALYNILANLLDQKKLDMGTKETKISLLAKEVGFQLLSDDFGVQLAESSPSQIVNEDPQLSYVDDNSLPSLEDQTSTLPQKFKEDCVSSNKVLLESDSIASDNDKKQSEHPNTGICLPQNQESSIKEFTTILAKELEADICTSRGTQDNKDDKGCKRVVLQSHTCPAKDLEKESPSLEKLFEEKNIDRVDLTDITSGKYLVGNNAVEAIKSTREGLGDWHVEQLPFKDSFFFSDGGYQLLRSLTGGEKIPSLVIVDPVSQQHYVYSEDMGISYSSVVSFIKEFLNGNLTPYQRISSPFTSSRESLRPPFVNQDFHEVDSVPRVTVNTFCELIVGYKPCKMGSESIKLSLSQIENFGHVWKTDVLVLFCTSYCGYCQRMELVVREVYRAFKNFTAMLKRESKTFGSHHSQDKDEDTLTNGLPSIFLMDCTMNDCGTYLTPISKKEQYPEACYFPAGESRLLLPIREICQ
ncbi:uncharacterized protein A4U43_C04F16420 [Asparagus officinalis]|uniref:Thioredoxin domain-containing protein n=1 Tax=Asparagus officinalis TaxID=4686 RepID=A0A5P1F665_ASPOF|nr:uncharacterized protein A4U43_C04F16420 [Asparagus officinalis]